MLQHMPLAPLPFNGRYLYIVLFVSAFILWIAPEIIASRLKTARDSSNPHDRNSLTLIAVLWFTGIALSFTFALCLTGAAIPWHRTTFFLVGIFLMLAGVCFRWNSARLLGAYFTFDVAIQHGQTLVEAGPYRYVRHPSYTGALVTLVGFGLALGNWASVVVGTSCLGLAYIYRIRVEEAALVSVFGESYRQYQKRTWRLFPFLL